MKKIRILQIVYTLDACGGIENYVMNYYRNIDRNKIQFDFIIHKKTPENFIEEVRELGGSVYIFPEFSFKNLFSILNKIKQFLRTHNYKIIHCNVSSAACFYFYYAKKYNIKHRILHAHQPAVADKLKNKIRDFFLLKIGNYLSTDRIACSINSGKFLFKNRKFNIIYNAINAKKFYYNNDFNKILREKYKLEDQIVIGHVGRFAPVKNQAFLLSVLENLLKINKSFKLIFIGDGETKEDIRNLVKRKNLENNVIFVDTTKEVYKYYSVFDIFILPSLFEGLPLVAIEAQYNGLPVILSKSRITKEVVISNNVHFLDLDLGAEHWAHILYKLVKNNKRSNTRNILCNNYDVCFQAQKLEEYYLKLVDGA